MDKFLKICEFFEMFAGLQCLSAVLHHCMKHESELE